MNNDLSRIGILKQGFVAAISAALSYLIISSALHVSPWGLGTDDKLEPYLAIGTGLVVFVVVLFRTRRGTWTRKHIDELSDGLSDELGD